MNKSISLSLLEHQKLTHSLTAIENAERVLIRYKAAAEKRTGTSAENAKKQIQALETVCLQARLNRTELIEKELTIIKQNSYIARLEQQLKQLQYTEKIKQIKTKGL